jgi:hypothetical protein
MKCAPSSLDTGHAPGLSNTIKRSAYTGKPVGDGPWRVVQNVRGGVEHDTPDVPRAKSAYGLRWALVGHQSLTAADFVHNLMAETARIAASTNRRALVGSQAAR